MISLSYAKKKKKAKKKNKNKYKTKQKTHGSMIKKVIVLKTKFKVFIRVVILRTLKEK